MGKLCTQTLYDLDGSPRVQIDEYMKTRLQSKLIRAMLNSPAFSYGGLFYAFQSSFQRGLEQSLFLLRQSFARSPLRRPIQQLNCVDCRYLFRCLSASCFRRIRTAQSGQYFARLDFGVNAAPHTAHRFTLSRLWIISVYSAPSSGRTAARNHRHSRE